MSWLPKPLIVLTFTLAWGEDPASGLSAETSAGVVSTVTTSDDSGLTRVAVRSPQEILLGTARGGIRQWNPATNSMKELRPGSPDGEPVSNLHWDAVHGLLAQSGRLLEIRPSQGEPLHVKLPNLAQIVISPTSQQLAAIAEEPPIWFFDPNTGQKTHRVDRQVRLDEMRYSPTGKFLATTRYGSVYLWKSETGELVWTARLETKIKGFVFSPDESVLFVSMAREGLWVLDMATGNLAKRYSRSPGFVEDAPHRMASSPDGTLLAATSVPDRIEIWETFTGRPVLLLAKQPGEITDLQFLPDGVHLVSADALGRATLWDLSAPEFAAPFQTGQLYTKEQLRELWRMLGEPQGHAAWSAMIALKHRPEQALALIDDPPNEDLLIRQLIQRLDDDQFLVRQAASRALRQLSLKAEPVLRKTLSTSGSAEVKVRVRRLLAYLAGPHREAQLRLLEESQNHRQLRVIQLLKWMRTSESKHRLQTLRDSSDSLTIRNQADAALLWLDGTVDSGRQTSP